MRPDRLADAVIESHSAGVFAQYTLRCYSSHFSLHPMEADAPHLAHPQIRYTIIKTARKIIVADIPILLLRCRWENVTFFHIIMQFELSCELSNFQRIIETQARQVSMMDNDILQFTMMGR
ncbi:unnamed protein product [Protopolystoma xenopodis]|uniref:Uncharacterized protein n=1 Tax=Protopolystoma xenopodis TaxID=117903 RepID=A0A3S5A2M0_9PLAT|nr:unnamed protein product [Protopolystoma xenopodis]